MILYRGNTYGDEYRDELLAQLPAVIGKTLEKSLSRETVLAAVERLLEKLAEEAAFADYFRQYRDLLSRKTLEDKLETELGADPGSTRRRAPLGVLLHVASGNMDVLPAYSVLEGLLTGNINILKMPHNDESSIYLLQQLTQIEPQLQDYIYAFDISSSDVRSLKKLEKVADAIVVWGSDEAVTAIRKLASANTKIIEWGHKISFAYLSGDYYHQDSELAQLAEHLLKVRGRLCSGCQVIYLDSEDAGEPARFANYLAGIFERVNEQESDPGVLAERSLRRYCSEMKKEMKSLPYVVCDGYVLIPSGDDALEINEDGVLIRNLPRERIVEVLWPHKSHLQTAGLLCGEEDREELIERLIRAKVTRITPVGQMSDYFPGEAHDGQYALQRYTRIVDVPNKE
ncbi:MAG: hypothetical protein IJS38_01015 [Erysipelotrichaceae bacterium]|nr:hypothetical protein [Erysipelotrichaceae bacterium]